MQSDDLYNVLEITDDSTEVPIFAGEIVTVNSGEIWPAPYRGSRYSIRRMQRSDGRFQNRICWSRQGAIYSRPMFKGLMKNLQHIKGENFRGSIRITPWREVLCKKLNPATGEWIAYYVGKLQGTIEFKGFDVDPKISRGQYWRGFHFKHGETWSVWTRKGSEKYLYWSRKGIFFKSINQHPDLVNALLEIRPTGGRCYITEYGHVWMNVTANGVSKLWVDKLNLWMKQDTILFSESEEYDDLVESIHERYVVTKTRPIYLGHISEFDDGNPPRTYFENGIFQGGTKNEDEDDEDGFSSSGYRRMRGA